MTDGSQPARLFIATPCYGGNLHYQYVVSLFQLTKHLDRSRIGYTVSFLGNESLVTRARNIMVGKFLSDPRFTHLLFVDADIQYAPFAVAKLLAADKEVSIGVYPAKSLHLERIQHVVNQVDNPAGLPDLPALGLNYMLELDLDDAGNTQIDIAHKLIKVKYGTTGFMLIKRAVLETMVVAYPELQYYNQKTCAAHDIRSDKLFLFFDCMKDPETNDYLSEDYAFSQRWRKLGGEIWADMESRLSHWGNYQFQGNLQAYLDAGMIDP